MGDIGSESSAKFFVVLAAEVDFVQCTPEAAARPRTQLRDRCCSRLSPFSVLVSP
jgi:hypothetical protein